MRNNEVNVEKFVQILNNKQFQNHLDEIGLPLDSLYPSDFEVYDNGSHMRVGVNAPGERFTIILK